MAGERLTGIDQGTLLAERMLSNGEVLRGLLAGGRDKETILKQVASELADDPIGQACFLRTLFRSIAREGGLEVTNKRDTALAILIDDADEGSHLTQAMIPLIQANPTVVHDAYIEAVQQQTRDNDPFSGSVDALLEAGKVIAPYLPQEPQRKQQVIGEWGKIVKKFLTVDERFHIRSKIEEIRRGMSPNSIFDSQVEKLRKQGFSNTQIAEQLDRKRADIEASATRLIAAGRIEATKSSSEAVAELDSQVEKLRKQGFSNTQIAEQLGRKRTDINASASRLIAAGRIEPAPKGRAVSQATIQLDKDVEQLRREGLTNPQISERLEKKRTDIETSARRLISAGRIERLNRGR